MGPPMNQPPNSEDRVVSGFVADDIIAAGELVAGWHDAKGSHARLALASDITRAGVFIATSIEMIEKGAQVEFVYDAKTNRSRVRKPR